MNADRRVTQGWGRPATSLVEMLLALTITGIIFAAAIIPTTQIVVAYQQAERDVRRSTAHAMAAVRLSQTAAAIWRDAEPPTAHDTLDRAQSAWSQVGAWGLRANSNCLEQNWAGTGWAPLAEPVQGFALQYLLNDGSWAASVAPPNLGDVLAVRYDWVDPDDGRTYGGLVVAPDHAFSAGYIGLPPPDVSEPYSRTDYERGLTLSLGTWQ